MRRTDSGGCAAPGLPYIMAASSEKTRTKADLRDETIERFGVSKSTFDFAWIWAIEETESSLVRAAAAFAQEGNADAADVAPTSERFSIAGSHAPRG